MFFALVLIALGVIFLLKNLGYISTDAWDVIWPILIIAAGLSFLVGKFRVKRKFRHFCDRVEDYNWDKFSEKMERKFAKFEEEIPDEIKVEMSRGAGSSANGVRKADRHAGKKSKESKRRKK